MSYNYQLQPKPLQALAGPFVTSGRILAVGSVGSPTISFGIDGINIGTGSGTASASNYSWNLYSANSGASTYPIFAGSPIFGATITNENRGFTTTNQGTWFMGLGQLTINGSNLLVFTPVHAGIKFIANGTNVSVYATQADGTTENVSSAITTIAFGDIVEFAAVFNGASSITYYVWKNRVPQTPVTLIGNMPTGSVAPSFCFSFDTANAGNTPNAIVQAAFYQ